MGKGKPKTLDITNNKAALLLSVFASMQMSGKQARLSKYASQRGDLISPAEKLSLSIRREKERYGNRQFRFGSETGERQAKRIQRQIAKGQLKRENGLISSLEELIELSKVRKRNCQFNARQLEASVFAD